MYIWSIRIVYYFLPIYQKKLLESYCNFKQRCVFKLDLLIQGYSIKLSFAMITKQELTHVSNNNIIPCKMSIKCLFLLSTAVKLVIRLFYLFNSEKLRFINAHNTNQMTKHTNSYEFYIVITIQSIT